MSILPIFTDEDIAWLRRPHISRVWLAEIDLPGGLLRVHSGAGSWTVAGYDWKGITDPGGMQLVSVGDVVDPRFGQAAKLDIVISGVNAAFFKSVKDTARQLEGRSAIVYWTAVDQETETIWSGGLKKLFPGYMSSPTLVRQGVGIRTIKLGIESLWQSQNFPWGGILNDADQRRRFPGDKGLEYVGVNVNEVINV